MLHGILLSAVQTCGNPVHVRPPCIRNCMYSPGASSQGSCSAGRWGWDGSEGPHFSAALHALRGGLQCTLTPSQAGTDTGSPAQRTVSRLVGGFS